MEIINGNKLAKPILDEVREQVKKYEQAPKLHIILATNDESSQKYVELKKKKATDLGIDCMIHSLTVDNSALEIAEAITQLCEPPELDIPCVVIVQLPLFPHQQDDQDLIINAISPGTDVDGMTAFNQGMLAHGVFIVSPAAVVAVVEMINSVFGADENGIPQVAGKHVVIVNDTILVGRPLAESLLHAGATVTVAHEHTLNLEGITNQADILISATGKVGLITADHVKESATVIDVGSIKTENGVKGDVARTPELEEKVAYLSQVPGGVGPLTIACLFRNLIELHELQRESVSDHEADPTG